MHKTAAWPLALVYVAVLVYASLYPFSDWRDQGIAPWAFLASPWPKYWTGFDIAINILGYMPLGFLLSIGMLRSGPARHPVLLAALIGGLLSLCMETTQSYLPSRVPSNVDFATNLLGTVLGAVSAWALERMGAVAHWGRVRERWFVPDARGAIVLLALWPGGLLFPASVPFGLGQVLERLEAALGDLLHDTAFLEWIPVRDVELQPLVPGAELLCVLLGGLIPCLLAFCVVRSAGKRAGIAALVLATGIAVSALSAALSYGPSHAWAWLSPPVRAGLWGALIAAGLALPVPRRGCAALLLLALAVHLSILNQAPASAYFAQTLQTWEQGRFIRFHGLAQWLGWIWPYVTMAYVLVRISRPERRGQGT